MSTPPKSPSTSSPPNSPSNFTAMCIQNLIFANEIQKAWDAELAKLKKSMKTLRGMLEETRKRNREMILLWVNISYRGSVRRFATSNSFPLKSLSDVASFS
ncbi:hypothetical protein LguiA_014699 [Lonicera macranthoides]